MQIIGNIFLIVLFVSAMGSIFTIVSLFSNHILRITLPLWFAICGMIVYIVPVFAPDVYLISPETQIWLNGFCIACIVWGCGAGFFLVCHMVRFLFANRAIQNYKICDSERIHNIFVRCAQVNGLKKMPLIYFGTLDDPACVAGLIHPIIILNKTVVEQLTERELFAVLCHEVTHIKRRHILLERIFDYICIINWVNPLVWIARQEFSLHCEIDCDRFALLRLGSEISETDYAYTMIRLLELSAIQSSGNGQRVGALSFLSTKRRIKTITGKPSKLKSSLKTVVLAAILLLVILFSLISSRAHFYPYPAYHSGTEYSVN